MTFSQLITVLEESRLSPEQLAPRLGVANMTIRRWKSARGSRQVPKAYERTVVEGIYQLIVEGYLSTSSEAVRDALADSGSLSFQAAIRGLGVDPSATSGESHEDKVAVALFQIGASEKRRNEVASSERKLSDFRKLGSEWSCRISALWKVIRSSEVSALDKVVAYGALFYLLCPFDLIPDGIPVVGLVDDFGILGFALAYYVRKFPKLVEGLQGARAQGS